MAQAVQALGLSPLAAVGEVLSEFVFQEQNRRQRDLGPGPHRAIVWEAVLREAQCRLQLLIEQLDLPAGENPMIRLMGQDSF